MGSGQCFVVDLSVQMSGNEWKSEEIRVVVAFSAFAPPRHPWLVVPLAPAKTWVCMSGEIMSVVFLLCCG